MRILAFLICLFPSLWLSAHASEAPVIESIFEMKDVNGTTVQLEEQLGKGKWTLVMIWATDCAICRQEKPRISAFHDKHKDKDAEVIGIALDGFAQVDAVKDYLQAHQPSFPNYVAELSALSLNYQAATGESLRGTPTYLLFNPKGELVANNPGPVRPSALEAFIARNS